VKIAIIWGILLAITRSTIIAVGGLISGTSAPTIIGMTPIRIVTDPYAVTIYAVGRNSAVHYITALVTIGSIFIIQVAAYKAIHAGFTVNGINATLSFPPHK
jgi:cytochrome bd-type quinol oxidase subunit 1